MPQPENTGGHESPDPLSDISGAFAVLAEEVQAYIDDLVTRDTVPDVLLHFTDQAGLAGILQGGKLWASLATALNDASETNVGPDLFDFGERMALTRSRYLESDLIQRIFNGQLRIKGDDRPIDYRTYVASLCAEDVAVHWMQYARGGTGVALVFDAKKLASIKQFRLCKVIYDTDKQLECIREIVRLVDTLIERCLQNDNSQLLAEHVKTVAASLLNRFIKMVAPQMKDTVFSAEDEWRLFSTEAWVPAGRVNETTRATKFRSVAGRIVPYKEVEIPLDSINEIRLGYSCSLRDDEQSLRVLMDECLGRQVPIVRSLIAVRP